MTIKEIAKLAGVSSAAVSRYLNGGYVSEEKKEQTNQEYLQDIVNELLADEEWELPKELRFWLMGTYTWELLYL